MDLISRTFFQRFFRAVFWVWIPGRSWVLLVSGGEWRLHGPMAGVLEGTLGDLGVWGHHSSFSQLRRSTGVIAACYSAASFGFFCVAVS